VKIDQQWTQVEDGARVAEAERMAARVQFEFPDAKVSVVPVTMGEGSDVAIFIESPDGSMEIRNPWVERRSE
jgi:alcohol dehydrogenase class IV